MLSIESGGFGKDEERRFDWRRYLRAPERLSADQAKRMDVLASLLDSDSPEAEEFFTELRNGNYRQPAASLVHFFRDVLTPDERKELLRAVCHAALPDDLGKLAK